MLDREIKLTQDGSKTIFIPAWNESYHSKHGALQEAQHVFIQHGLEHFANANAVKILEFGFGTGLNCLLSYMYSVEHNLSVNYTGLEKYPIEQHTIDELGYDQLFRDNLENKQVNVSSVLTQMHSIQWNESIAIHKKFNLKKLNIDFKGFKASTNSYDLVYFDAFGIRVQPELWDVAIFENIYSLLKTGGMLTTYAANGKTKRALQSCGFDVKKLPGPPGKREMINAWKI